MTPPHCAFCLEPIPIRDLPNMLIKEETRIFHPKCLAKLHECEAREEGK